MTQNGDKNGKGGGALRPWRKRALQIITTDIWRKDSLEEVTPLQQVAGHGANDTDQAILSGKNGCILKPIQAPPRGLREVNFYKEVFATPADKAEASGFKPFLPKYFGTCRKRSKDGEKMSEFLIIENLAEGFQKPCIMDVKIGGKTYGPDATAEKIKKQDASYSGTKKQFGFSVLGMSVYTGVDRATFKVLNKEYGKYLNETNIQEFLENYLDSSEEKSASKALGRIFGRKLEEIHQLFKVQTSFHLYGSSVLFVYDAAAVPKFLDNTITEQQLEASVVLKMIDFAHVWPGEGQIDTNYLFGIENLSRLFNSNWQ